MADSVQQAKFDISPAVALRLAEMLAGSHGELLPQWFEEPSVLD